MSPSNIAVSGASSNEGLLRPALTLFVLLSLVTGLIYPLAVTGVAQLAFPQAANGSLILRDGQALGSRLIGQSFSDPRHFWGRPSAEVVAQTGRWDADIGGLRFRPGRRRRAAGRSP